MGFMGLKFHKSRFEFNGYNRPLLMSSINLPFYFSVSQSKAPLLSVQRKKDRRKFPLFFFTSVSAMESLGLSPLNSLNTFKCTRFQKQQCRELTGKRDYLNYSKPSSSTLNLSYRTQSQHSSIRVSAVQGDDPGRQMKELADARKRWDALIREEKVKVLTPREAGYAIKLSYKTLLDVRPSNEREKAWVKGSTWIPVFDVDSNLDAGVISKKITNFMMGGWWSGIPTFSYNKEFIPKVVEKFPVDSDLIVACQKGLRSLAACEQLYNAGYRNLFWVQGGLEAAEEEDLEREGPQPFKFAGIGGVSEFLGWTDQQRAAAAKEGWGYRLVFSARLIGLIILADALFIGAQQLNHYLQDLRSP